MIASCCLPSLACSASPSCLPQYSAVVVSVYAETQEEALPLSLLLRGGREERRRQISIQYKRIFMVKQSTRSLIRTGVAKAACTCSALPCRYTSYECATTLQRPWLSATCSSAPCSATPKYIHPHGTWASVNKGRNQSNASALKAATSSCSRLHHAEYAQGAAHRERHRLTSSCPTDLCTYGHTCFERSRLNHMICKWLTV